MIIGNDEKLLWDDDGKRVLFPADPSFPAKTVPEFITHAKANLGKINLASSGTGNLTHLSGELFRMTTGIEIVHVPYRGTPAAHSALLAGDVHAMFDAIGSAMPQIQAGALRALGVRPVLGGHGIEGPLGAPSGIRRLFGRQGLLERLLNRVENARLIRRQVAREVVQKSLLRQLGRGGTRRC